MVDFNKKIVNSKKFLQPAIHFQEHGLYCFAPAGTTEYMEYWEREQDRCLNGYLADDGDWISGYNYFYLNYCPILRIVEKEIVDRTGKRKTRRERVREFPDFYDYDYYFFMAVQEAQEQGKHLAVLKSRRKGYSFKLGAMMCRNYYHIPGSKSFAFAAENEFLVKDGIITKAWEYMDFIDENTAWGKKRQKVDTKMHRRASFVSTDDTGNKIELGYKSEIIGVTTKNDVNKIRGKAGHLIVIEEGGKFPNLLELWQIARPSVEQDGVAFGTMIVFGCVCAGTRVCTADGKFVNIEDLHKDDGIIGWDTYQAVQQKIENINPPSEKECVRITLRSGRTLECSTDHPLLWSTPSKTRRVPGKRDENTRMKSWLFHEAGLCKVGEQVGIIDEVPIFGNKDMWEPRLVGWLIGDGSYGPEKTPRLSSCDVELNSYIDGKFNTVIERSHITKDGKEYRETRIKGICENLLDLGIYGQTKSAKRLPVDIYDYNYESSMELLGGLFDTDGYIMFTNNRCKIVLTQAYKEILLQVQELLLKIGVHSIIRYIKPSSRDRKIKDINGEYRLEINDNTSLAKFSRNVNMSIGYKNAALDLIALYTESHLAKHRNYVSGVHADKIVKIENIGIKPIYNITAADNHNYICNGIITHNTGGSDGDDFSGLRELFYYPEGYNCLPLNNIWDEGADGTKCGFFIPQYTNLDIRDENGVRLYMDDDGNTFKDKSREYVLGLREDTIKNSTDARAIDRYIAEQPCLDGDTLISTEDGISKISENPKSFITGTKDLYRLRTSDGTEVLITKNHPIYNGVEYIPLENMNVGDKIKYQSTVFKDNGYVKISIPGFIRATNTDIEIDEDWALFIGLFMGDGSFYWPTGNLKITMDRSDVESISWCSGFLERNFGDVYLKTVGKNEGGVDVGVNIKHSINVMKALGVLKSSSNGSLMRNVHIPEYIYKSKKSVVASFLKGLFDSDGHAIKNGSSVGFFSKNNDVLQGVQFLLRGFDINANISNRNSINGNGRPYIENKLSIRACDIPKFREHIGFISKRKLDRIVNYTPSRSISDYSYSTIESITYEKTDIVWDITTDSHNFSACGIWVHNCTPQEACLELTGNIFPKKELQAQLSLIKVNRKLQNHKQVGDLIWVNGELVWQQKQKGDITKYPLGKDDDTTGAIVIWEHPVKDHPIGLYIGGNDPYDFDKAENSTSLGSTFIYKRFQGFEEYYDIIVA